MPLILLPILLLALPVIEIAVFIVVGREIGVLATVGLVVFSAVFGVVLLRAQGVAALARLRAGLESGSPDPGRQIAEAPMIALAAILLIVPGFVTDGFGLLLFIPPVRALVWRLAAARMSVRVVAGGFENGGRGDAPPRGGRIIEHDADERKPADRHSPWRDRRDPAD